MAAINGLITTDLQTVGVKVDMDDAIQILPIWDVPLQKRLGSAPCNEVRIDWLEDTLTTQAFNASSISDEGADEWEITGDDTSWLRVGDVIQADDAVLLTTQYTISEIVSGTVIEVVSAYGATTDVDPTATINVSLYRIVGQLNAEGSDPPAMRSVDRTNPYNYTQIGQEGVAVSRTERKRATYGVADEYTYQVQKKFKELAIRMERSFTVGTRYQSGAKRFMGGLLYYVLTNTQSGTAAQAKAKLNALALSCYNAGGAPKTLYVSPAVKVALSANVDSALRISQRTDSQGGYVIDSFLSDFGSIDLIVDRHLPKTKALLVQEEYVTKRVFDGYFHEFLAKTGDADKGEIVGEWSLEVKNDKAHGLLTVTDA